MEKAYTLGEIDAAVNKFEPVMPDHPFYVNFENVRGDFQEQELMSMLNVRMQNGQYKFDYRANQSNQTILFLAGMRGSGKTSELAKYARRLHSPECFFVVTCNVDEQLDMDNIQYMDIVIFQLEQLLEACQKQGLALSDDILSTMKRWFDERVLEINRGLKAEGSAEIEMGNDKNLSIGSLLGQLLGLTVKLKAGLSGSAERAIKIRQSFQNRFGDFSKQFNTFIASVNEQLRRHNKGKEVLFIIDGLEKTMSAETRRKIIMEESKRAIEKLGNNTARYLEDTDFQVLKTIKTGLEAGNPIGFNNNIQNLLEKEIIFEYNDGTYKRVNPLLEVSKLYRHHVLQTSE